VGVDGTEELAAAFERETGCPLQERDVLGMRMLLPADDRFGSFGILVGRRADAPHFQFETRAYGGGVELVLYGKARVKQLDKVLKRLTSR
jgi:hypothetical protein